MKFPETIGDLRKRQISGKINKPLRSYRELSEIVREKYNITDAQLRGWLRKPDAPKSLVQHKSTGGGQNSWYNPREFMAWIERVVNDQR
jgi:hypothetical protein